MRPSGKKECRPATGHTPPQRRVNTCTLERRNAVLLQDIHLHKGESTHARLPCQACPQLCSAAFPRCNTLKHKKTYTPIPTTIPGSLIKHVFLPLIPLDSAAQFWAWWAILMRPLRMEGPEGGGGQWQPTPSLGMPPPPRLPPSNLLPIQTQ